MMPIVYRTRSINLKQTQTKDIRVHTIVARNHMIFSGVRVTRSIVLCVCIVDRCSTSDHPSGIFKLFCIYYPVIYEYSNNSVSLHTNVQF